jgi:hypothetical protein
VTDYTSACRFRGPFPGSRLRVSLSADQQQVLDRIESDLEDCEPRLRSMFAIFTRLTRDDGTPKTESLRHEAGRLRRIWPNQGPIATRRMAIAVPIILCLLALLLVATFNSSTAHVCGQAPSTSAPAVHTQACQPTSDSYGRP